MRAKNGGSDSEPDTCAKATGFENVQEATGAEGRRAAAARARFYFKCSRACLPASLANNLFFDHINHTKIFYW